MQKPILPKLRVKLLGRFALYGDGGRAIELSSRKSRGLIAYLAMNSGRAIGREQLADLLWGDRADGQARHNLRQCLLAIRGDLGEQVDTLLDIRRGDLQLSIEDGAVDAHEFARLARSSDAAICEAAAPLYTGAFLQDIGIDDGPFAEWVRTERASLSALAGDLFRKCAESSERAGEAEKALYYYERLVALDPLREDYQRLVLKADAIGRGSESALKRAHHFAKLLRRDLDVAPDKETQALVAAIRHGEFDHGRGEPTSRDADRSANPGPDGQPDVRVAPGPPAARRSVGILSRPILMTAAALLVLIGSSAGIVGYRFAFQRTAPAQIDPWQGPKIASADPAIKGPQSEFPNISILVLPFERQDSSDPQLATIASILTEDVIAELSRIGGFRVISQQTARFFASRPFDPAALGKELQIKYVANGSVRLQDGRIRITLALTSTATRSQTWSDRTDYPRAEWTSAPDDLVRRLARALNIGTYAIEERTASISPDIRERLFQGWSALLHGGPTPQHLNRAERIFTSLLEQDPTSVRAMIGLAAHNLMAVAGHVTPQRERYLKEAENLLGHVHRHPPITGSAHFWLGMLQKLRNEDVAALGSFRQALALTPSFAPAYGQIGHVLLMQNRPQEAIEHIAYATRLSPNDPAMRFWGRFAGEAEIAMERDAAAIGWLERAAKVEPDNLQVRMVRAAAYALSGDRTRAIEDAEVVRRIATSRGISVDRLSMGRSSKRLAEGIRLALSLVPAQDAPTPEQKAGRSPS